MTYRKLALLGTLLASCGLVACGGGGGGVNSITAPPVVPPPPPPPPPPPSSADLVPPLQTEAPASPVATAGGPSFDGPEANTVFPLMLTATVHGGGDAATTQQGATMTVGPNGTTAL